MCVRPCIHPYRTCWAERARRTIVSVAIIYIAAIGTVITDCLIEYSSGKNSYRKRDHGSCTVRVRVKGYASG